MGPTRTGVFLASLLASACVAAPRESPAHRGAAGTPVRSPSPERERLFAECRAWCDSLPACGPNYASAQGCRADCDPDEPDDTCVALAAGVYRCMRISGYDCKGQLRFPRDECSEAYALAKDCENLAATPEGGEGLRAACNARCKLAADCSGVADDVECARSCNGLVADTFAECVSAATAAYSCSNERGSVCREGKLETISPDPCEKERLASRACQRSLLDCEGADRAGNCPPVTCDCGSFRRTITEPDIHGKWCRCVPSFECSGRCF